MKTAICIFPTSTHKELTQYFTDMTTYYANRMKFVSPEVEILYANSIDHGLKEYASAYNHILFMASGCRIFQESIVIDIGKEIEKNPDYLCAAHILDWTNKNEWYELHRQFVLINTDIWRDIDRPKFGDWTEKQIELPIIERSVENFHDDYTPLWIKDSGERKVQRCGHPGWNFLDKGLRMGCDIINWNQEIRSKRTFYYPEADSDIFWECIKEKKIDPSVTNFNQKNFLNFLVHGVQDQIWLYNSEEMSLEHNNEKYDIVALPASGFKYLDVFKSDILNKDGKIVIYDFNPKAIQWIKTIHQSREINIELLAGKFEHQKNFKQIKGYGFNKTIEYFEDLETFCMYLDKFRQTDIIFVECDLIKHPEEIIEHFKSKTLFHISNIFSTDWLVATYGLDFATEKLRHLLKIIPGHTRVTGMSPTYPSIL